MDKERSKHMSDTRGDEAFNRVLEIRSKRLGVSLEEARKTLLKRPRYSIAAEKAAAARGVPVETVLSEDIKNMRASTYPGRDCLTPSEISEFIASKTLSSEAEAHIENAGASVAVLHHHRKGDAESGTEYHPSDPWSEVARLLLLTKAQAAQLRSLNDALARHARHRKATHAKRQAEAKFVRAAEDAARHQESTVYTRLSDAWAELKAARGPGRTGADCGK